MRNYSPQAMHQLVIGRVFGSTKRCKLTGMLLMSFRLSCAEMTMTVMAAAVSHLHRVKESISSGSR